MNYHFFLGICRSGAPNALMEFVLGKLTEDMTSKELDEAFTNEKYVIRLIEPVLIQRVLALWQDPKTGERSQVIAHQFVEDRYWPIDRGVGMPFKLDDFRTVRILDPQSFKDAEEIKGYETHLTELRAKSKGLVLPGQKR